jgi:hypothetical protein
VEAGYQTLLSGQGDWNTFSLTPDFEVNLTPRADFIGQTILAYTNQSTTYNSFEVRPLVGLKYYFTPAKRVELRGTVKYEHRMFHQQEIDNWMITNRIRFGGEIIVPINRQNFYNDKMWYGVLEGEWFYVVDENVKERFAVVTYIRAGIGYRLSYGLRFELFALSQTSRDVLDKNDVTQQGIIRVRVKHYLNRANPPPGTSNGN